MKGNIFGAPLIEYLPALGFLLFTLIYLTLAYSYEVDARAFPAGVAWVMLVLTLCDLVSRSKTSFGIALLRILNPAAEIEGPARGIVAEPKRQLFAILWIFGFAILLSVPAAFLGILPYSVIAEIAERDSQRTGQQKEAMYFAVRNFSTKLGQTLGIMTFAILTLYGKDPGNDFGIRMAGVFGAILCIFAGIIFVKFKDV